MSEVLFVSQLPLGRCENMTAVWNAFDPGKTFRHGVDSMRTAESDGFSVVVCDALPAFIEGKSKAKSINICHAITGNKVYGLHEHGNTYDRRAFLQTDVATAASEKAVPIVASQLGIPEERVAVTGFPRSDALFDAKRYADFMSGYDHVYLYLPTFRYEKLGGWLPHIDWECVDSLLEDGEVLVVKRHYFTEKPLVGKPMGHVIEVSPWEATLPYLSACHALITDYSSAMFDAYLMGVPVVLVVDDKDDYLRDRPMYFPYPEFYGSSWLHAEGYEHRLVNMVRDASERPLTPTERECVETVAGACDGHSTERVCELIRSML